MAKKLFSFSITEDDEPEYFGKLMDEHHIEYYIVPGSVFGFTKPGFWITRDEDFPRALELFRSHEAEFARLAREKYQAQTGYQPAAEPREKFRFWLGYLRQRPMNLVLVILGFGLILWYFSLFFGLF